MANYTMYYRDYVTKYGAPEALNLIPSVTIGGTEFNFSEMFFKRYKHREICAETPELFKDYANRYLEEIALIYAKKIKDWEQHLDSIWEREIKTEETTTDNMYWNPTIAANNAEGKSPKLQSTSEHKYPHHIVFNTQSNADLIAGALEVQNIFYDALESTETLFMSLY